MSRGTFFSIQLETVNTTMNLLLVYLVKVLLTLVLSVYMLFKLHTLNNLSPLRPDIDIVDLNKKMTTTTTTMGTTTESTSPFPSSTALPQQEGETEAADKDYEEVVVFSDGVDQEMVHDRRIKDPDGRI